MSQLCRMTPKNCKINTQRLLRKLALESSRHTTLPNRSARRTAFIRAMRSWNAAARLDSNGSSGAGEWISSTLPPAIHSLHNCAVT